MIVEHGDFSSGGSGGSAARLLHLFGYYLKAITILGIVPGIIAYKGSRSGKVSSRSTSSPVP